jgi:hypothetical protein
MPAKPRSEVFDPDVVGVYHCWNELVQQRHLFGFDELTGRDYSYRKEWVRDRFKELAGKMAIDFLDYAILGNHLHVVLRNRPDIVDTWTDEEVARRWWFVCPGRKNADGSVPDPKPCEIGPLLKDAKKYRSRLSDISWIMRLACQRIAVRANREDDVRGRFFAHRFDCKRLETWADVLACSIYVDLNLVRAGVATTPEESKFSSAYDRIRARWRAMQSDAAATAGPPSDESPDAWLAPVFLDERAEAYAATATSDSDGSRRAHASPSPSPSCNPIRAPRISNKGFLPMTRDQYLSLLDVMGRVVRAGKRGFIPPELPPILERLRLNPQSWLESVLDLLEVDRSTIPAGDAPG